MSRSAIWPVVLAAVVIFGYGCHERQVGEYKERIARLEKEKSRVDTLYRRDTLTLTKVRRVTDSILLTDTLIRVDTVRLLIAAERKACDAVISTCEDRVAYRDSIITVLKRPKPLKYLPWIVGGYLLHEAIH